MCGSTINLNGSSFSAIYVVLAVFGVLGLMKCASEVKWSEVCFPCYECIRVKILGRFQFSSRALSLFVFLSPHSLFVVVVVVVAAAGKI
jgi:hypothetical protein